MASTGRRAHDRKQRVHSRAGNIPLFFRDATTFSSLPSNQSYRPLVSTLLAIDYRLAHGLQPFWFHLSIFILFIALTLLLALVIHHLLESEAASSSNRWIALAAAAWYALHPANADTINYIIVSAEVISALGVIASFAVVLRLPAAPPIFSLRSPGRDRHPGKTNGRDLPRALRCVSFAASRTKRADAPRGLGSWKWSRLFVICGAVLLFVQHMTPPSWMAGAANARNYLVTQPYVALLYFKTFFWPTGLSADYDLNPFVTAGDVRLWIGFAFAVLIERGSDCGCRFQEDAHDRLWSTLVPDRASADVALSRSPK